MREAQEAQVMPPMVSSSWLAATGLSSWRKGCVIRPPRGPAPSPPVSVLVSVPWSALLCRAR